jgi:hypothetical protein
METNTGGTQGLFGSTWLNPGTTSSEGIFLFLESSPPHGTGAPSPRHCLEAVTGQPRPAAYSDADMFSVKTVFAS